MKKAILLLLITFFIITKTYSANVITWIPPYAVPECKANLTKSWGGYGPKDGLSHLALQFWVPDGSGGIQLISRTDYDIAYMNDDSITAIRDWGNQYGIKTMLCIYNAEWGWDWGVATSAFLNNKESTINALLSEVDRLSLGGVEVDLEKQNGGMSTSENNAFVDFLDALGDSLHARGLDLTVAAGANENLGPDWNLWSSMAPHVDGITSMGYGFIGMNASDPNHKFSAQKSHINDPSKLMMGVPGYSSLWEGNTLEQHLTWIRDDGVLGVGIWDLQLNQVGWLKQEPWLLLSEIRGALTTQYEITASATVGGSIDPIGKVMVDSATSKEFKITADQWYIVDYVEVDGSNKGAITSYTFSDVTTTHTIKTFFKEDPDAPDLFIISTTANSNGSISPEGPITASKGSSKSFTIIPESGYQVQKVLVNGTDRGPIVNIELMNVLADHSIEAFFEEATGGDLGKYEEWYSSIKPAYMDTVFYNDSLWAYTGDLYGGTWGANMAPSIALADQYGTPPWTYSGLYNATADSSITSDLVYKSGLPTDTLIITTTYKASGSTYDTKVETLYVNSESPVSFNGKKLELNNISISKDGKYFNAPIAGNYSIKVNDLRGRSLYSETVKVRKSLKANTNIDRQILSNGIYLITVENFTNKFTRKIIIK